MTLTVELAPAVVTAGQLWLHQLVAASVLNSVPTPCPHCAHHTTPHTPHFRRAVEPHVAASASTGAGGAVEGGREK